MSQASHALNTRQPVNSTIPQILKADREYTSN